MVHVYILNPNTKIPAQTLLEAVVAAVETPIADLPLLSRAEQVEVALTWNTTAARYTPYEEGRCVHEMFEAVAKRTPHATAVVAEGRTYTYYDVNGRANILARYLRASGHVKRESIVAIFVKRSLDMVVAMLAVAKAGGAYVPMDPHYPAGKYLLKMKMFILKM